MTSDVVVDDDDNHDAGTDADADDDNERYCLTGSVATSSYPDSLFLGNVFDAVHV